MNSRETILAAVKQNQPRSEGLKDVHIDAITFSDVADKFSNTLISIGGTVINCGEWKDISDFITLNFSDKGRVINTISLLSEPSQTLSFEGDPHALSDIHLAVIEGSFGVAENGAVLVTDTQMKDRALPFICEHLAVVIKKSSVVATLHEAYDRIGLTKYEFATFIAGPSKTADIEQSLVLGAHGPKSLIVFILNM